MARFQDAESLTAELRDLAAELHAEFAGGEAELERLVDLADRISERADALASAFTTINETLLERLQAAKARGQPAERRTERKPSAAAGPADLGEGGNLPTEQRL